MAPRPAAEQRDGTKQTEHDEKRNGGEQESCQLAEHQPSAEDDVGGTDQQAEEEQEREEVSVPLDSATQISPALTESEMVYVGLGAGEHQPPVTAQDLDTAEAPAEPLAFQSFERQRHDSLAERAIDVQPGPAVTQNPKRQLGVLGDAPLVPPPGLLESAAADG